MNGAFYIGATGLHAQERALTIISNNIANLNTPSFKRSEVRFSELMAPREAPPELAPAAPDARIGMAGVAVDGSARIFGQGELRQTGRALDIAIDGDGFIELLGPAGQTLLWRGGSLKIGSDGYLATAEGLPLKAMISIPDDVSEVIIAADGGVLAITGGDGAARDIGRIELAIVRDTSSLSSRGGGLYAPEIESDIRAAEPGESGVGRLIQGSIEASNVQLSDEMVTLLLMQRSYAASAQVLQAGDQLMAIANSLKR